MKTFHRWKGGICQKHREKRYFDVSSVGFTTCAIFASVKNRAKVTDFRKKNQKKTQLRRMQVSCQCKNMQKFDVFQKVNIKKRLNSFYALRHKGDV